MAFNLCCVNFYLQKINFVFVYYRYALFLFADKVFFFGSERNCAKLLIRSSVLVWQRGKSYQCEVRAINLGRQKSPINSGARVDISSTICQKIALSVDHYCEKKSKQYFTKMLYNTSKFFPLYFTDYAFVIRLWNTSATDLRDELRKWAASRYTGG